MKRRQTVLRLLLTAIVVLTAVGSGIPTPAAAAPTAPHVNWSPCHRETGYPFECAVVPVPLDYGRPGAASILLSLVRLPAGKPSERIGSLFLNPGGPGGSGVDFAVGVGPFLYSQEVRDRFDLVGFDPRGVGRSTGLKCFGNDKQAMSTVLPITMFPVNPQEAAFWEAMQRQEVAACEQRAGRIVDHMTTADVARDLDLLRRAVGDEKLNYAGYSYGSYLGVTYANMFPDRVRALVVDAVIDPVAWATGRGDEAHKVPFFNRVRSVEGAEATLAQFFQLCDEGVGCAFAPNSSTRFDALAERIRANPVALPMPDGTTLVITYQYLMAVTLQVMYSPSSWPDFAQLLFGLEYLSSTGGSQQVGSQLLSLQHEIGLVTKRGVPNYTSIESQAGVMCSDSDNPTDYQVWRDTAVDQSAKYPHFGAIWTWISSICATWQPGPAESRYYGPFDKLTANPVLVVGNLYDPATPYHGAVTVHDLLPNSALLTVEGWGHASLFLSSCADATVSAYLLDGVVPREGATCAVDVVPFAATSVQAQSLPSGKPSAQALRAEWLAGILAAFRAAR